MNWVKQIKSWRFAANFDEKKSYQNFSVCEIPCGEGKFIEIKTNPE